MRVQLGASILVVWGASAAVAAEDAADRVRFEAVRRFADNVLEKGRDHYGLQPTPLLVDGVNVDSGEGVTWKYKKQTWTVCDPANHHQLYRVLVSLTNLTGDKHYRAAAEAEWRYLLAHYADQNGLLKWGGHRLIDLRTGKVRGEQDSHEFKCNYPYYAFLWETDPAATERFVKAFWNAHVLDWRTPDMNRHGSYDHPLGKLWQSEYEPGEVFFVGKGLTFVNAGSDLIYAAGCLYKFTGDRGALDWAKRLAQRYVEARDPHTHLGAYQYSRIQKDRAFQDLGGKFPQALEGKVLDPGRTETIYGHAAIAQLRLAEMLGDDGKDFLQWTREGLLALARHDYDPRTNLLRGMLTDGTIVRPEDVRSGGYYSPSVFKPQRAGSLLLVSYALACRLTGDEMLWPTTRAMARHGGLGDWGAQCGKDVRVNLTTDNADPHALFALLEVCRWKPHPDYLALARRIGDNIIAQRFIKGFFLPGPDYLNASVNATEPLALLSLEAAIRGQPQLVPAYCAGRGYIHGPHDGMGRTYDSAAIYSKKRGE
jgi:pectate lyase